MNRTEERLIVTGMRYLASATAITTGGASTWDSVDQATNTDRTDARDTYYTARDAAGPDHEHQWITDQQLCDPVAHELCVRCGAERDAP